jgi:hypothetical protein
MNFFNLATFLTSWYEHLFARRFRIENERLFDVYPAAKPPPRRRFSSAGAIFPSEPLLPRYQY